MPLHWTPSGFRQLVRASAGYDLLITAPFATPWTLALLMPQLSGLNESLGGTPLPAFEAFHVLLGCLMGSLVLVWSLLRLRHPEARMGRYDGAARLLFSGWMLWAWLQTGAPVIWLFLLPELVWALLQLAPLVPTQRARPAS